MMSWNYWHGEGEWMMAIGMVVLVVVIAMAVYLIVRAASGRSESPSARPAETSAAFRPSAIGLLDARYARGEIEREDYLNRRQDLLELP